MGSEAYKLFHEMEQFVYIIFGVKITHVRVQGLVYMVLHTHSTMFDVAFCPWLAIPYTYPPAIKAAGPLVVRLHNAKTIMRTG